MQKSISRYWLLLGTAALAIAGLFSLVLVVARTPQLAALPGFKNLFHQALVVHVDLSVLVWFLAIACLLWSRLSAGARPLIPYLEEAALASMALGTLAIALSPLDNNAPPLMSNYIPVIMSPVFFVGLGLVLCGVLLMVVLSALSHRERSGVSRGEGIAEKSPHPPRYARYPLPKGEGIIRFALFSAAIITFIAIVAFYLSYRQMPAVIEGAQYYELLFWGGGHVLQFTHVQIAMVCWLLLISKIHSPLEGESQSASVAPRDAVGGNIVAPPPTLTFPPLKGGGNYLYVLFSVGLIAAIFSLLIYLTHEVSSFEHRQFFTNLMILANGIAPMILALWILPGLWRWRASRKGENRALWSALLMSLILFIYGGVLGGLIEGQDVMIPAHYHGSIVGVTLAFMGLAYLLLPQFGYRDATGWKLAYWQPLVYGIGQIMHISGLAYSGGYGVLRKTPGVAQEIALPVKAALGFMGLGGLLAIIGGFMFVVVVVRSMINKPGETTRRT